MKSEHAISPSSFEHAYVGKIKKITRKVRDQINSFLGKQISRLNPSLELYVYSSPRLNLLQSIVGSYSENPNRAISLWDFLNDRPSQDGIYEYINIDNVDSLLERLNQITAPDKNLPPVRSDLRNLIQYVSDKLNKIKQLANLVEALTNDSSNEESYSSGEELNSSDEENDSDDEEMLASLVYITGNTLFERKAQTESTLQRKENKSVRLDSLVRA
jgi:hypothetical protein